MDTTAHPVHVADVMRDEHICGDSSKGWCSHNARRIHTISNRAYSWLDDSRYAFRLDVLIHHLINSEGDFGFNSKPERKIKQMSHFYTRVHQSSRKTDLTARGHKNTGIAGWVGGYNGVLEYRVYQHEGIDWLLATLCKHPDDGGSYIQCIYDGPLDGRTYYDNEV